MLDDPMNALIVADKILNDDGIRWYPQTWMEQINKFYSLAS